MSNLSNKTAYKALLILGRISKEFDKLAYLDMTKEDDWDSCQARNLINGIIQSNGYEISYDKGKRSIVKVKK